MEAVLLTSDWLVAVIVSVPAVFGAVYIPVELIWPFNAFQATDLFEVVPVTVAVSCNEPPTVVDAALGVIAIDATADPLSPLPWLGLAGLDGGLEALAGFAVIAVPAQPPIPKEPASSKDVIAKLVVPTAFLNGQIMERRDSLSSKLCSINDIPALKCRPQTATGWHHPRKGVGKLPSCSRVRLRTLPPTNQGHGRRTVLELHRSPDCVGMAGAARGREFVSGNG